MRNAKISSVKRVAYLMKRFRSTKAARNMYAATQSPIQALNVRNGTPRVLESSYVTAWKVSTGPVAPLIIMGCTNNIGERKKIMSSKVKLKVAQFMLCAPEYRDVLPDQTRDCRRYHTTPCQVEAHWRQCNCWCAWHTRRQM